MTDTKPTARAMRTAHTPTPWRVEAVSDAVRVVTGTGRGKIILVRLAPPQLPESETYANGCLMAAAPALERCRKALDLIVCALTRAFEGGGEWDLETISEPLDAAIKEARTALMEAGGSG